MTYWKISQQLLAGSRVNDTDKHRQTALHMAAANNSASIVSVLLENGIEPDAVDERGNNGIKFTLHSWPIALTHACRRTHADSVLDRSATLS